MKTPILEVHEGDVIDDLTCIKTGFRNNHKISLFKMKCNICGREKIMPCVYLRTHIGTTHKACSYSIRPMPKRFYRIWAGMRERTTNSKLNCSKNYFNRGITSDPWKYFIDFYDDMYSSYLEKSKEIGEENVSIERIDVNGNYCKENCTWIHKHDQASNLTTTLCGKFTFPDGHIEYVKDIHKYSLKHGYVPECMCGLLTGKKTQYRGIKGERISYYDYERFKDKSELPLSFPELNAKIVLDFIDNRSLTERPYKNERETFGITRMWVRPLERLCGVLIDPDIESEILKQSKIRGWNLSIVDKKISKGYMMRYYQIKWK